MQQLGQKGHQKLYIDGGNTIQNFLQDGLIDEMIITAIPILLGGGAKFFGDKSLFYYFLTLNNILEQALQLSFKLQSS